MKTNSKTFSLRLLLVLTSVAVLCAAFYARHKRMNTPHPLAVAQRIERDRNFEAPVAPVFYRNPPLARTIRNQYNSQVLGILATHPPGTHYFDDPAIRLLVKENPSALDGFFEAWFSTNAQVETLINATQIVYQTEHATGIQKANQEIIRRFQTVENPVEIEKLCLLATWDPPLLLPHVEQQLHRFPADSKLVTRAVMTLDEYGTYDRLSLLKPTVELLKSWLDGGTENEQYFAVQGLAYTPFRETQAFGDRIRLRIAAGERLYTQGRTALSDNPGVWVHEALTELRDGVKQQPEYARLVCKYGGVDFVDFFRDQIKQFASADALLALQRVKGNDEAIAFLRSSLDYVPLKKLCLLLDNVGENAVPDCLEFLEKSTAEELQRRVIEEIVLRKLGTRNSDLIEFVETFYRSLCESDFRLNAKRMLNALARLEHPDVNHLAKLLPGPDPFSGPAVTMTENDLTIDDFVDFLNIRSTTPIDPKLIGVDFDVTADRNGALQCRLHDALLQANFAMELCETDWDLDQDLDSLFQSLVLLTDGQFSPDGIRWDQSLEISWKNMVFADVYAPYFSDATGLIELINAILDQFGETDARFVSYPNKRGNEYPTIVFLSQDDVETLDTRFGLKPNQTDALDEYVGK